MNEKNKMEIIIVRVFLTQKNYGKCDTMGMNCYQLLTLISLQKDFLNGLKLSCLQKFFPQFI